MLERVRDFLTAHPQGVVGTTRPDGTVRQSVTYFVLDGDKIQISTESKRAKARDVMRTGRASLCVLGAAKPFPSTTLEGPARILHEGIAGPTARIMQVIVGGDAPALTDEVRAARARVILEIDVERVYGVSYIEED